MAGKYQRVNGLPEMLAKLRELATRKEIETIAYRGTFGAAKEIREQARANAQAAGLEETGAMLRGFAMKRIREGSEIGYTVGMRSGRKRIKSKDHPDDNPWYWWLQEFGTVHTPPKRMVTRAFQEATGKSVQQIIRAGTKAVIDSGNRVLKKIGNGAAR
jgi:HK97 gp10 family phage protein